MGVVVWAVVSFGVSLELQPPSRQGNRIAAASNKVNSFFICFLLFGFVKDDEEYINIFLHSNHTKKSKKMQ